MKTHYEYRAQARETLQNRWGEAAITTAIIVSVTLVIMFPSLKESMNIMNGATSTSWLSNLTSFATILLVPIQYAFYIALLNAARKKEIGILQDTVQSTVNQYGKLFITGILYTLIISIISLFTLGIGGIIFAYAYRMVPYLLHDYPELTPHEALKISRQMMQGRKGQLFVLDLTFIGWYILALITCGIGYLFLTPYMQTATAHFYEDLKAETIVEEED